MLKTWDPTLEMLLHRKFRTRSSSHGPRIVEQWSMMKSKYSSIPINIQMNTEKSLSGDPTLSTDLVRQHSSCASASVSLLPQALKVVYPPFCRFPLLCVLPFCANLHRRTSSACSLGSPEPLHIFPIFLHDLSAFSANLPPPVLFGCFIHLRHVTRLPAELVYSSLQ